MSVLVPNNNIPLLIESKKFVAIDSLTESMVTEKVESKRNDNGVGNGARNASDVAYDRINSILDEYLESLTDEELKEIGYNILRGRHNKFTPTVNILKNVRLPIKWRVVWRKIILDSRLRDKDMAATLYGICSEYYHWTIWIDCILEKALNEMDRDILWLLGSKIIHSEAASIIYEKYGEQFAKKKKLDLTPRRLEMSFNYFISKIIPEKCLFVELTPILVKMVKDRGFMPSAFDVEKCSKMSEKKAREYWNKLFGK